MSDETDSIPLDGKPPLNEAERRQFRYFVRLYDRIKFACKLIIVLSAWAYGLIIGASKLLDMAAKHFRGGA